MFYRFRRKLFHLIPRFVTEFMYVHQLENVKVIEPKLTVKLFKLNYDNVDRISEVKNFNIDSMTARLTRGDDCIVTEYNDEIISYQWVQFSGRHYIMQAGYDFEIPQKECMVYHARVLEDFRGNRINSFVKSKILEEAKANGIDKVWVYTNKNNIPNRKGLEKLGFELESKIFSVKISNKHYQILRTRNQ